MNYSSKGSFAIGWGRQEENARFMFEYYYNEQEFEMEGGLADFERGHKKVNALYYSGYWEPEPLNKLQLVLGAGVGFAKINFEGLPEDNLYKDSLSGKLTAGIKYRLLSNMSLYANIEQIYFQDAEDDLDLGEPAQTTRAIKDIDSRRLSLGLQFFY